MLGAALAVGCGDAEKATAPEERTLTSADYGDRLRALWLGQSIANWTGLVTEGVRIRSPFFTDDDWGTAQGKEHINGTGVLEFVFQDPWGSDDDTDIEYIYLAAMAERGRAMLTPAEIRDAWIAHTEPEQFLWVSNLRAQELMLAEAHALPPSTSLFPANDFSLMIDAQLTTEFFGALAPGDPATALQLADLPIRVTASGYAAHASQFFVALYSLALVPDPKAPMPESLVWLVRTARKVLPDTSKAADVVDFVLAEYLNNPDPDDWEQTRDAIALRYQTDAERNAFSYLSFYESPINLATAVLALLYGEGDFRRTVQVGSLSGWDSDNGTATMGGLLGLMLGTEALQASFPEQTLSDDYDIHRTRTGFKLPSAFDTFTAMAERMLPLVEAQLTNVGGRVDRDSGEFTLPRVDFDALDVSANPLTRLDASSVNNRLRRGGEIPQLALTGVDPAPLPLSAQPSHIADGVEFDFSGSDGHLPARGLAAMVTKKPPEPFFFIAPLAPDAEEISVAVTWTTPVELAGVRFVEGAHFTDPAGEFPLGGWFESVDADVRVDGEWVAVGSSPLDGPPQAGIAYEIVEWMLDAPTQATGVRIRGVPAGDGGAGRVATIAELEGIQAPSEAGM